MMPINIPSALMSVLFSLIVIVFVFVVRFIISTLRPANFPPGPPTIPGLGNLHQIPLSKPYLVFTSWAKTYGSIIGLKFGPTNVVILHRAEQVRELLERRGAIYAARPRMAVPCDYVLPGEWESHAALMTTEFQRRQRKAIRHHLGAAGLEELAPIQRAMAARLMYELSSTTKFAKCFHHWALATPLPMIGGQRVEELGQEWVDSYHATQVAWLELLEPGLAPPVDVFPVLRWMPQTFAGWKRKAYFVREGMHKTYDHIMAHAMQQHTEGKQRDHVAGSGQFESLIGKLLREESLKPNGAGLSERDISMIGGSLLDAAVDTSLSVALFLVQVLAANPDIQRRAQAEIDAEWGRDSMPNEMDISKFPYLSACINEVLRWRPTAPLSVPRQCVADENVFGYRVPKGSTILINLWAIHHDREYYDRPEDFDPDRFLQNPLGTKVTPEATSQSWRKPLYVFGAGRRACPGDQFALNSLHLLFTHLLWAYEIVAEGELDLDPVTGVKSSLAIAPVPFEVKFVPRSDRAKQVVLDEYHKANQVLKELLRAPRSPKD